MHRRKQSDVVQVSVRMREGLRRRLEKEAKASRVSLNSAIIHRLELSLEDQLLPLIGADNTRALLVLVGAALTYIEMTTGKRWNEDPDTRALAMASVYAILKGILGITEEEAKQTVRTTNNPIGIVAAMTALQAAGLPEEKVLERWTTEFLASKTHFGTFPSDMFQWPEEHASPPDETATSQPDKTADSKS